MRTIIALAFILSVSFSAALPSHMCNNNYGCQEHETCCRTFSNGEEKFQCFLGTESVCCSDLQSACPNSTKCNLTEKVCEPEDKDFLSYLSMPEEYAISKLPVDLSTQSFSELEDIKTIYEIIFSFLEGLNFTTKTTLSDCTPSEKILVSAKNIYGHYKTFKNDHKVVPLLQKISAELLVFFPRVKEFGKKCVASFNKDAFKISYDIFKIRSYPARLLRHTIKNLGDYTLRIVAIVSDFSFDTFSFKRIGELVKDMFFDLDN